MLLIGRANDLSEGKVSASASKLLQFGQYFNCLSAERYNVRLVHLILLAGIFQSALSNQSLPIRVRGLL